MARGNETTTKFKVDISELKKAMQEAKKQVSYANSEFKAVSSSMDDWSKSSDGISAKLKQLNSNLNSQESVLKEYEKALDEVKKEYGENSDEAREYATKLNNQQAVVNKTKKEIAGYEDALREVADAEKIASKSGKTVAEVLEDVGDEAEDAGDGFTTLKGAVATFAGNVLTGLANGLKDAVGSLMSLSDETREYRDQMSKLNSAGTEAGYGVDYVKEKYKDLYGVLADETATTTTVSNFMALNAEQETLDSLLNSSIGIWAKYGDSIPLDGLAESINETAKVGSVTGNLADALNWAGINEDKFNESLAQCTSEQGRQQLIANVLERTYGDLSASYQASNASVIEANQANADYTATLADMGAKIEPVTTTLKEGFNGLLQELLKLVGDVDMEAFTAKIEEGFAVLKDDVLPAVKEGFQWILDNKDALIAGLTGLATAFGAFKVASLIQGVVTAMQGMTVAQYALNLAMSLNPIGIIVSLIAGLIVAFVTLWNKSDSFREFWINLWENISGFFKSIWEGIVSFFTETIPNLISNIGTWFSELPDKIYQWLIQTVAKTMAWSIQMVQKAKETATNFINNVINFFKQLPEKLYNWLVETVVRTIAWSAIITQKAKETGSNFIDNVITFFKELPTKIYEWLISSVAKTTAWAIQMVQKAKELGKSFIDNVVNFFKQLPTKIYNWLISTVAKTTAWGIQMVLKAKETGLNFINNLVNFVKQLPEKVWTWLVNVVTKIGTWGINLANKAKEAGQKLVNGLIEKVKSIPEKIKTIGSDIVKGLWNGISNMTSWIKDKISGFGDDVLNGLKDFFGIHSPSKLMADEVGRWLPEGIAVGITDNAKSTLKAMKNLAVDTVGSARAGLGTATTTLGGNGAIGGGVVNNFYQTINSPKQLSRLDIYRQSKNLLGYAGGGI